MDGEHMRGIGREGSPWPMRVLALAVGLLVTAPVLAPGFVLLRDMVFVPRQDLDLDALGLSGTLPRAVPIDSVMALLTVLVPGDLVQKAVLLGTVVAAVLGAARLVPADERGRGGTAAAVAGLVYGWSPYLAERLLLGHWTLLLAYAALPWIAGATLRVREGVPGALPRLLLACAPAALTPTGAVLAGGVVVAMAGRRALVPAGGAVLALALPWIVAGALHPSGGASDPAGVAVFAARAEGWGGPLLSVLAGGGVWNAAAVPASRTSVLVPMVTVLFLVLAAVGALAPGRSGDVSRRLLPLGVLGVVLSLAGALPGSATALQAVVESVPGGGLLRDAQKWVAWWMLPLAVLAALGTRRLAALARRHLGSGPAAAIVGTALLLPVVAVPDLAWGVGGRLQPVDWPAAWQQVRDALADDPAPGDVLALPAGVYRGFAWNDGRPQLDPAARWLSRTVVADDTLVVGQRTVSGEDPRARAGLRAAGRPSELAGLGIGWVLVEHGTPGPPVPAEVTALPVAVDTPELTLYRVPGADRGPRAAPVRVGAVVAAHVVALGAVSWALLCTAFRSSTVPLRRPPSRKWVPE
jgi:hypothetical protein